jgi:hypothetical protein
MKIHTLILAVFTSLTVRAQLPAKSISKAQLPKAIVVTGELVKALQWSEPAGQHYVVVTTSGIQQKPSADGETYRSAKLSVKHFLQTSVAVSVQWEVKDGIADCPLDAVARFFPDAIQVTDLTKDGTPEIWILYTTACRGDVSPATLKLILYEGATKYAMRGTTQVPAGEKQFMGGDYRFDSAFDKGAAVLKIFAKGLWDKYRTDTLE